MGYIYVQPIGDLDKSIVEVTAEMVEKILNIRLKILPHIEGPTYAFDPMRMQYHSTKILKYIVTNHNSSAFRTVGITDVDLFIPILTYVFGEAQLDGRAAIVSTARLRQEFYGLKYDRNLLIERLTKETLHELGHTFGFTHCELEHCVMHLSNKVADVDQKTDKFCANHQYQLNNKLSELEMQNES